MPQLSAILLLDQGGHSTRAILFDLNGNKLCQVSCVVETYSNTPQHFEMDLSKVVDSLNSVLAEISLKAQQLGINTIVKAGLIVQRSSFVACHKDTLAAISPIISWMDNRNSHWLAEQQAQYAEMQQITGLYPNAHYALSKIRWLLQHNAAIQQHATQHKALFVPLAAFLAHKLCNTSNITVDAVIASRTLMMDLAKLSWSEQLTQMAGISPDDLPPIVASDHVFGTIRCGSYQVPLSLCGGDQSFVAFSAGLKNAANYAFVNVGSGAFIQALCDPLPNHTRLLKSPLFIGRNHRYQVLEGTVNAAASALDDLFRDIGQYSHTDIKKALVITNKVPIYINLSAGSGSPYWLAAGKSRFSEEASPQQKIVAVLENIVFSLVVNWRKMQPFCSANRIVISGGLSLYDQFCQKLADCSGLTVERFTDHEASARGAAYFMLTIEEDILLEKRIFSPTENAPLLKRYQQFESMMDLLCQKSGEYP